MKIENFLLFSQQGIVLSYNFAFVLKTTGLMILCDNTPIDSNTFSEEILHEGLSLYEVCRVFQGKVIFLDDNIARLQNSIQKSHLNIRVPDLCMEEKLEHLIHLEHICEGNIKYVLHVTPQGIHEYIYQIPHSYPTEKDYRQGVDTITCRAVRNNAEVKYLNPPLRQMTDRLIREQGIYEVLLIDQENKITEGSRSNVFFIKDNFLYTAPLPHVLPGTSRKRVLEICHRQQIPVVEERVSYSDLNCFEAAFLTGTSPLVLPIRRTDDIMFNPTHPLLRQIMQAYFALLTGKI